MAGIGSSTSPRRRASDCSSSLSIGGSCSSVVSPSGSPVDVLEVRSTSVTYLLSRPTKHEPSLVAAPDNCTKRPVANGSSVPVWPVRAPVRRRSSATSAKDDRPAGLSTRTTPTGLAARDGIRTFVRRGDERAADEVDDLVDRLLAREPRRLTVAAAALLPGDRGDVDLVLARTKRDPVRRAVRSRRLSNQ